VNVATTVAALRRARVALDEPVGFVPTMGFLHAGHLALVDASRRANRSTVVSIFVNPKQFGPSEDFRTYPRDLDRDLGLLERAGVDLVFAPTVEEIYPPGFSTVVEVGALGERLEGASRPGHFRGVATVVARLFGLVGADRAYFGQKDAQQCVVVKKLVAELAIPVEVTIVPTVREADGLALSSRNVYLGPVERVAARVLSVALRRGREAFEGGERRGSALRNLIAATVATEPLARLDYASVADPATLVEVDVVAPAAIASLAARIGTTRLIDSEFLGSADAFAAWCRGGTEPGDGRYNGSR
jgi:pantoate--beta-alanine ligase